MPQRWSKDFVGSVMGFEQHERRRVLSFPEVLSQSSFLGVYVEFAFKNQGSNAHFSLEN
jgi:hypothetical protein